MDAGNEIDLTQKNLLSWQSVWNSRQTATDIKEKLANQEEVLRGVISHNYLSFSNTYMETMQHKTINTWLAT